MTLYNYNIITFLKNLILLWRNINQKTFTNTCKIFWMITIKQCKNEPNFFLFFQLNFHNKSSLIKPIYPIKIISSNHLIKLVEYRQSFLSDFHLPWSDKGRGINIEHLWRFCLNSDRFLRASVLGKCFVLKNLFG